MANNTKLLSVAFSMAISTMICPSMASAAVIYSNGFENGLQPLDDFGQGGEDASNGFCSRGGTNPLLGHTGCPSVVPTGSIDAGTDAFVAFAAPGQTGNGAPSRGSTLGFSGTPLVDGYHGRYEFSFTGSGVRQLVFVDQVWTPFLFLEDPESPFGGEVPQSFESSDFAGTSVSIEDNRYLVTFDLDERTRFFDESVPPGAPPGTNLDPALFSICGSETDQTNCSLNWFFAIDNGGWIDDIELNFLDPGDDGTPVPEPSTLALLLTGVITAGAFTYRGKAANRIA
jgi:hypothetical protein